MMTYEQAVDFVKQVLGKKITRAKKCMPCGIQYIIPKDENIVFDRMGEWVFLADSYDADHNKLVYQYFKIGDGFVDEAVNSWRFYENKQSGKPTDYAMQSLNEKRQTQSWNGQCKQCGGQTEFINLALTCTVCGHIH